MNDEKGTRDQYAAPSPLAGGAMAGRTPERTQDNSENLPVSENSENFKIHEPLTCALCKRDGECFAEKPSATLTVKVDGGYESRPVRCQCAVCEEHWKNHLGVVDGEYYGGTV